MDEHGEDPNSEARSTPLQYLETQETDDLDKNVNPEEQALPKSSTKKKTVRCKRNTKSALKNETPEERNKRLTTMRERRKQRLLSETDEEREKRLSYLRDLQRERIRNETKEERQKRLRYMSERQKERMRMETPEAREKRLARCRKQKKKPKTLQDPVPETDDEDDEDDVLYMAETHYQEEFTPPQSVAPPAPMYVGGYGYQYNANEVLQVQQSLITVERVWSLRPNESVADQMWFRNQV